MEIAFPNLEFLCNLEVEACRTSCLGKRPLGRGTLRKASERSVNQYTDNDAGSRGSMVVVVPPVLLMLEDASTIELFTKA